MDGHQCMAFKYCFKCKVKYCDICEAKKHVLQCLAICEICLQKSRQYDVLCDECSLFACSKCFRRDGNDYAFCKNCFDTMVCGQCGKHFCECVSAPVFVNTCSGKAFCKGAAIFECLCKKIKLCKSCFVISDTCDVCRYHTYCPAKNAISVNHYCSECYNVFTDPKMKNHLLTTLLCLSQTTKRLPKPIRLMICERIRFRPPTINC